MAAPFAGFGSFLFQQSEMALAGTDTLWISKPIIDQAHPLGSAIDNIQVLAFASAVRTFEANFSPARHALLLTLLGTAAIFVDWQVPVPDARQAFFSVLEVVERAGGPIMLDNLTRERRRLRLGFIAQ